MAATNHKLAKSVHLICRWAEARAADRLSDTELVRRYVGSNDEAAFGCLVERHGPMVLGYAL